MIIDLPPDVMAPDVAAVVSPAVVRLGEPFTLFITATYEPTATINLVRPLELSDAFEALPGKEVTKDTVVADGRKKREWQVRVVAWELGDLMLPPIAVTFSIPGMAAAQTATKPVPIKVVGTLGDIVDDKAMRPMAKPTALMSRDYFLIIVAAAVLAAIIAVIVGIKMRTRRRRRVLGTAWTSIKLPRRLEPAAEEALRRLAELEASGRLADADERTPAYRELSDIMRTYLGRRAGFVHHDRTTREIMERLRKKPLAALAEILDDIEDWLEAADLVKFAAYEATADEARTQLESARALVLKSIAEPRPKPEDGVNGAEPPLAPPPSTPPTPPVEAAGEAAHG